MKIVFISSLLPTGHYTENLLKALHKHTDLEIITYTDRDKKNKDIKGCGTIIPVWRKNMWYIVDIMQQLPKDKPDIVHVQHELTMFGGIITAVLFPILIMVLRLSGYRVVTTIHAVIAKKQVTNEFISNFMMHKPFYIIPFTLRMVFSYIFTMVGNYSHLSICHTQRLANILVTDYGIDAEKVITIAPVIPEHTIIPGPHKPYFLYFGYMVRRKGLELLLDGLRECIKKYPEYRLILAGGVIPGQEHAFEELKQKIAELGLRKHVQIRGFIADERELDELYAKAYAVLIPARLSIAASGPLYHAQGYHKCILASDIGNFKEQIHHGHDGLLVPNDSWGVSLIHLIEHPEIVQKLEKGARLRSQHQGGAALATLYQKCYNTIRTAL